MQSLKLGGVGVGRVGAELRPFAGFVPGYTE